jgi:hypothetical protein
MVPTKVVMDVHPTVTNSSAVQAVAKRGDFDSGPKMSAVFTMMLLPKLIGHVRICQLTGKCSHHSTVSSEYLAFQLYL